MSKPSIVFAHGIWADGSCFQKLIPTLRAEGHEVMAAQYGLDTLKADFDATIRTFGRVSGPIVLVGHSYGGTVITHAGTDPRVAALVYIASLGPDENETPQGQQDKFPVTDVFKYIDVADGRVWLKAEGTACFAGDLSPEEQEVCDPLRASLRPAYPRGLTRQPSCDDTSRMMREYHVV
jgi:pimeloyl-ACP methyl ester carboxylesterase